MKSYYTHLKSTMEFGEENTIARKPILRSSGVFPVIQNKHYSSKISFLGHLLEETKIRYDNNQNLLLIFLIFCNAIFKFILKKIF